MTVDGHSLLAVATALCVLLGLIVLALERRLSQPMPGLRLWSVASFTLGAAAALHATQGLAPMWLPGVVGNAFILIGRAASAAALRQFDRRPVPRRLLAGACAALILGLVATMIVWPSYQWRGMLTTGGMALFTAFGAVSLAVSAPMSVSRAVAILGLAGLTVTNVSRFFTYARWAGSESAPDLGTPAIAVYIGALVTLDVLSNVGFVLLITDRMLEWVQQLARTDHLTGALSRGALYTQAQRDLQRARRHPSSTAAFIVDIDNFKSINDQHGHAAGDAVLRHVARQGLDVLRCTDLFGRYGGDEFVAVLPQTDLLTAAAIADRLRRAVGEEPAGLHPGLPPVTVSIGVAAVEAGTHDIDELIAQADQALYTAKQAGRNRTRVADDSTPPEKTSLRVIQGRRR